MRSDRGFTDSNCMRRSVRYAFLSVVALALLAPAAVMAKGSVQREATLEQGVLREVNRQRVRPRTPAAACLSQAAGSRGVPVALSARRRECSTTTPRRRILRRAPPPLLSVGGAQAWNVGENLLWAAAVSTRARRSSSGSTRLSTGRSCSTRSGASSASAPSRLLRHPGSMPRPAPWSSSRSISASRS